MQGREHNHVYLGNAQGDLELAGWYSGNSGQRAHTVAQKTPNAWGLYDMHGNVYEWCQDWSEAYTASNQTNPTGAKSGTNRIIRGGGWNDNADAAVQPIATTQYPTADTVLLVSVLSGALWM